MTIPWNSHCVDEGGGVAAVVEAFAILNNNNIYVTTVPTMTPLQEPKLTLVVGLDRMNSKQQQQRGQGHRRRGRWQQQTQTLIVCRSSHDDNNDSECDVAMQERTKTRMDRRRWFGQATKFAAVVAFESLSLPQSVLALSTPTTPSSTITLSQSSDTQSSSSLLTSIRSDIQQAKQTLELLLQNWERAVIDCTYADVPRDLLEQKNKQLLLEKASTYALFDKSVSIVSCKTVVRTVRDYLGRTGIGPVAGLEATLKQAVTLVLQSPDSILLGDDVDAMDRLIQTVEEAQRELNRADTLAYSARRDFTSMNNFDPADTAKILADSTSNLALCQAAIQTVVEKLQVILDLLSPTNA
ncbi:hypothetical protein ACA910_013997 [Epithemia clementina (nom. ined.)]